MNKLIALVLIASFVASSNYGYNGSTTAVVALVGGIIKAKHVNKEKKYPRKDCPVCKGKGWYISGDKIEKVDCGYCEPDKTGELEVTHPPAVLKPECNTKVSKQ